LGGGIQSLAIGGITAMNPKILVMIDPGVMLNLVEKTRVCSTIKNLSRKYGTTIMLSEAGMNIESVLRQLTECL